MVPLLQKPRTSCIPAPSSPQGMVGLRDLSNVLARQLTMGAVYYAVHLARVNAKGSNHANGSLRWS